MSAFEIKLTGSVIVDADDLDHAKEIGQDIAEELNEDLERGSSPVMFKTDEVVEVKNG